MRLEAGTPDEGVFDLTPLIDVVFLLLVFFLASTTFAKEEVEMDLTLPESNTGVADEDGHLLVINVQRDGTLTVDGRAVTMEGLRQRLRAAARRDREQQVLIRGDTEVAYGLVHQAVDACKEASLTRLAFASKPMGEGAPR